MIRDELTARLKAYEWTDFECKKARVDVPKDAYLTISTFANTQGSWLLFGVSENACQLEKLGSIRRLLIGCKMLFLSLYGVVRTQHIVHSDPHVYELEKKRVLAFHIPELSRRQKPLHLNGSPWDAYIRRGARDEEVTDIEPQCFLRDNSPRPWDSEVLSEADIENGLELDTLHWYQGQFYRHSPEQRPINDPREFLEKWNFLARGAGQPGLTRAAILLFGVNHTVRALVPRPIVDYQCVDAWFEHWSTGERWYDRMVLGENLIKIWCGLVAKYSRVAEHPFSIDPSTLRRNNDPSDYIAFREAAINLLIHQDYGDQNRKASIKWFIGRLVLWNPGNAFASTVGFVQASEQDIRNPLIVNVFYRIGLSDQVGTGIRTIVRNWRDLGRVAPQTRNDKGRKSFELILQQRALITLTMQRFQQQLGVNLDPVQVAILAQVEMESTIQVVDAAMIAGVNLVQAAEVLDFLHRQQLLQPTDQHSFCLTDPIRVLLEEQKNVVARAEPSPDAGTKSGPSRDQVKILHNCLKERAIPHFKSLIGRTNRTKFRDQIPKPMLEAGEIEMVRQANWQKVGGESPLY